MTNLIILYLITDIVAFIGVVYSFSFFLKKTEGCGITYFKIVFGTILLVSSSYLAGFITLFLVIYFLTNILGFSIGFAKIIGAVIALLFYYLAYRISKRLFFKK